MFRRGISGLGIGLSDLAYVPTTPDAPSLLQPGRIVQNSPHAAPPAARVSTGQLAVPTRLTGAANRLTNTLRLQPLVDNRRK